MPKKTLARRNLIIGSITLIPAAFIGGRHFLKNLFNSPREQEYSSLSLESLRDKINTVDDTRWYCVNYLNMNPSTFLKSPKEIHKTRLADCDERSIMAFYLNMDNDADPGNFLEMFKDIPKPYETIFVRCIYFNRVRDELGGISGYVALSEESEKIYSTLGDMVRGFGFKAYRRATFDINVISNWVETDQNLKRAFKYKDPSVRKA